MGGFHLKDCELGVATAATQIEGGRARTNWHRWAEQGHIDDGSSPVRATDHWNRVGQDIELLGELGVRHYRMGLEWARIEPEPGVFDAAAIQHYRDELEQLRAAGITPLVTLHHFNNPLWFEDDGGFLSASAIDTFLRYTERVVNELGDLVEEWITINEPNIYGTHGYLFGEWPPGIKDLKTTIRVFQVMAEVHIRAYELIHRLRPGSRVGVAQHLRIFAPKLRFHPRHVFSAKLLTWLFQTCIQLAMNSGRFRYPLVQPRGIRPGRYYDFLGINYYSRSTVTSLQDAVAGHVEVNDLGWEIYPEGLIRIARELHDRHPDVPIYVTENGTADATDAFRSRFIYDQLKLIGESGLPIQRYYHWTFIDNWEWAVGEAARFGLVHCDFETQERTMKDSGRFFAGIAADGGVTEEAYERYVRGQVYARERTIFPTAPGEGLWG